MLDIRMSVLILPLGLLITLILLICNHSLITDRHQFDYTALWTAVGTIGVFLGISLAYMTIQETRSIARSEAYERFLRDSVSSDIMKAFQLIVPARVPLKQSKFYADAIDKMPSCKLKSVYFEAIQLVQNYYVRVWNLYESNAIPREDVLTHEAWPILNFFFVVQDILRTDESTGVYDPTWRDWVRLCCSHCASTDQDVGVLAEWATNVDPLR